MRVYVLKSCDTCKKALKWLDAEGISYTSHDVRADGLQKADVSQIVAKLGWETAVNRRSTTWRELSDGDKNDLNDAKAVALILEHPTLLKRPVFVAKDTFLCGFTPATQAALKAL